MTTDLLTLISSDTELKKTAGTHGGEYHGACPFCGGRDRFAVWPNATRPGWWCRMCEKGGDAIQYLREKGYSFHDACAALEVVIGHPQIARSYTPPVECLPPSQAWRASAGGLVLTAQQELKRHARAVDYLHSRGLTDHTIAAAGLGYNPATRAVSRAAWGLEPDPKQGDKMWLPAGIVIPCRIDNQLWKVQIRRDDVKEGQDRYKTVTGSSNALYGASSLKVDSPAMLVEGPFDALAVWQEAGTLISVAACGTSGARRARWITRLALASEVLIALDADDAGDGAASWWLGVLENGRRWRPYYDDPGQMLQDGADVRGWVLAGLGRRAMDFHPEIAEFWSEALTNGWTEHLERLRRICAERGADYDLTIASLRGVAAHKEA